MKHHEHFNAMTSSFLHSRRVVWIFAAALLMLAITFCGCVSRPALNEQTFAFSTPASAATNSVANGHVLEIKSLQIAPPFDGRSLIYRTGEFSYQRDPYAKFLGLPAEGLVGPVSEMLRRDGGFSEVVQPGSAVQPDTLVELTIIQLYGDIRKPRSPCAVLAMQVTFIAATNGMPVKVILQNNYSKRIPINSTTPAALMEGWSEGLVGILAEATSDFQNHETQAQGHGRRDGSLTQKPLETP
jgi:cholesterol transport system auxiliary component